MTGEELLAYLLPLALGAAGAVAGALTGLGALAGGLTGMVAGVGVAYVTAARRGSSRGPLEETLQMLEHFAATGEGRLAPRPSGHDRFVARTNEALDAISKSLQEGREEGRRLASLLDNLDVGVILLDSRRRIQLLNLRAETLFRTSQKEALGQFYLTLAGMLPLEGPLEAALSEGSSGRCEVSPTPGTTLDVRVSPVPDGHGVQLLVRDVTQLRRAEHLRSELVANISHELKTPVTGILGFAETLLESSVPEGQRRHFLEIIRREAERLSHLVDDLLDLSSLEQKRQLPAEREVDAAEVARSAAERMAPRFARKKIEIELELRPLRLQTDPERVEEILMNFLDNAAKYTPHGRRVGVRVYPEGDGACFDVWDEGPGIPQEAVGRVFERFYRVDPARSRASGGTGLGLSIAKHLAESLGGSVEAESSLGEGSTFRLRLYGEGPASERRRGAPA